MLEQESGLRVGSDFNVAFSPERVDPGRTDYHAAQHAEGGRRDHAGVPEPGDGALRPRLRRDRARLDAGGGRADQAAGEHLPLGQHRAGQRARDPRRPDGHRHLGGGRRRLDQALRLHALRARPRHGRPLPAGRPVLPRPGARASSTCRPSSSSSRARSTSRCRTTASSGSSARSTTPAKPVSGSRIAMLGVSYKGGVGDIRESPALRIIETLAERGGRPRYHDPYVPALPDHGLQSTPLASRRATPTRSCSSPPTRDRPPWPRAARRRCSSTCAASPANCPTASRHSRPPSDA